MNTVSSVNADIDARVLAVAHQLEPDVDVGTALRSILLNEVRRRLAAYELMARNLEQKYAMTLTEFEDRNMVEQLGYAFEVENDHQDWDQAVDASHGLRKLLRELTNAEDTPRKAPVPVA